MKVHILQIPPEGKHLEGEEPSTVLDLQEAALLPVAPISYSLEVGLSDGGLFATGQLSTRMQMQCVKCLELFARPVAVPDFACQVELGRSETVDLTEPIREDILLALPAHPHCDWNGERVCPGAFPAALLDATNDSPPDSRELWGPLDQLKLKP